MRLVDAFARFAGSSDRDQDWREMGAYEALWLEPGASFKRVAERIAAAPSGRASDLVRASVADEHAQEIQRRLAKTRLGDAGLRFHGTPEYPERLKDAAYPLRIAVALSKSQKRSSFGGALAKSARGSAPTPIDAFLLGVTGKNATAPSSLTPNVLSKHRGPAPGLAVASRNAVDFIKRRPYLNWMEP